MAVIDDSNDDFAEFENNKPKHKHSNNNNNNNNKKKNSNSLAVSETVSIESVSSNPSDNEHNNDNDNDNDGNIENENNKLKDKKKKKKSSTEMKRSNTYDKATSGTSTDSYGKHKSQSGKPNVSSQSRNKDDRIFEGTRFDLIDSKYVYLLQLSTYSTIYGPKVKYVWRNNLDNISDYDEDDDLSSDDESMIANGEEFDEKKEGFVARKKKDNNFENDKNHVNNRSYSHGEGAMIINDAASDAASVTSSQKEGHIRHDDEKDVQREREREKQREKERLQREQKRKDFNFKELEAWIAKMVCFLFFCVFLFLFFLLVTCMCSTRASTGFCKCFQVYSSSFFWNRYTFLFVSFCFVVYSTFMLRPKTTHTLHKQTNKIHFDRH